MEIRALTQFSPERLLVRPFIVTRHSFCSSSTRTVLCDVCWGLIFLGVLIDDYWRCTPPNSPPRSLSLNLLPTPPHPILLCALGETRDWGSWCRVYGLQRWRERDISAKLSHITPLGRHVILRFFCRSDMQKSIHFDIIVVALKTMQRRIDSLLETTTKIQLDCCQEVIIV